LKILVVDDDFVIRELIQEILAISGKFLKVEAAEEGNSALDKLNSEKFDIVLTDINMPNGMGGFELIDKIVEDKLASKIFVFSGNSDNKGKCEGLPIQAFYKKPITNIEKFIKELLEN
jgi:CheY-like chemotaxis protein